MKVLTRRNAALKNTAVTSRAIRASVINRRNSEKIGKRTTNNNNNNSIVTKSAAKEIIKNKKENGVVNDTSSHTATTEKTKENVKPQETGITKKRGRPFKAQPKNNSSLSKPKLQTDTNATSNHTANNKTQTKDKTRSSRLEKREESVSVKTPNAKTRSNTAKKSPEVPASSSGSPTVNTSADERSREKNNNETIAVLTKGPFSSLSETSKKNDRKYQCGICMKVFLGSNDLRKHLRIHR